MNKQLPQRFPIVAIVGPTAVGKTDISIRLAKEIKGEIVNFDSIQIYKHLNIGSAKPTAQEQKAVAHHLFDIVEPNEFIDVTLYVKKAIPVIKRIIANSKTALLTGGTGFYLNALLEGLSPSPNKNIAIRHTLKKIIKQFGTQELIEYLKEADETILSYIHPNDTYRFIRALEVLIESNKSISWWWKQGKKDGLVGWPTFKIGLIRPREELYKRIEKRVDKMIEEGLIEEVKSLLEKGYNPKLRPLRSLGYRHIIMFLSGEVSLDEAIYLLKRDTRHYAKRQITWFKADPTIKWFHPEEITKMNKIWKSVNK